MDATPSPAGQNRPLARLLGLAWPIVIARATQAVIGITDAIMVAPLGEASLAATTTGAMNTMALIILPMGTVFIVQSFAAQLTGRDDASGARRYGVYGLWLAGLFALVAAALVFALPTLVAPLGLASDVAGPMIAFVGIRLLAVGPIVATEALGSYFGGKGNTRISMVCGVTAMMTNIALNYLLIEPRLGLPGYGVGGAAAASSIASTIGLLPALAPFLTEKVPLGKLAFREFLRMVRFGLPNGVNWFLEFGAFVFFIDFIIGHLGTAALAAFNVVMQLNSVSFMPAFGVTSAGAILVGDAIGRGDKERVPSFVWLTTKVTAAWMLSVGAAYVLLPEFLLAAFTPAGDSGTAFTTIGLEMLAFAVFWQLGDALNMTLSEALRAAGDTTWSMFVRVFVAWAVFTPIAYYLILVLELGVKAAMLSLIGYVFAIAALLVYRFLSGKWREIELVEPSPLD